MRVLTDLHIHTIASDHAYSTLIENAHMAKERGLEAIAITDHTKTLVDCPHRYYFSNMKVWPEYIDGVRILKGAELNILNENGDIDLDEIFLKKLDIVVASIHGMIYEGEGGDDYDATAAYLNVLDNPYVDILGHTGSPLYKYDIDTVVKKAKSLGKLIEINASSFKWRKKNIPICTDIALSCMKHGAGIVVNSDSHICFNVGDYDKPLAMLSEIGFPEELIINRSYEALRSFLGVRKDI